MSQPRASFIDSPYFIMEPDHWHLTKDAPEDLKKEFEEYMNGSDLIMKQPKFMTAKDVAAVLGVSESSAYRIIKKLNKELTDQGYIVIAGKISRRYFEEKTYI